MVAARMALEGILAGCMSAVRNRVAADIPAGYMRAAVHLRVEAVAEVPDLDRRKGFARNPDTGSRCKLARCCSDRVPDFARLHRQPASSRRSDWRSAVDLKGPVRSRNSARKRPKRLTGRLIYSALRFVRGDDYLLAWLDSR
jgi:hypothetical protein